MSEKTLFGVTKYLLVAILFLPLLAWSDFALDYTLARSLLFFLFVEAAALFYVLLTAKNSGFLPKRSAIVALVVAYITVHILSFFGSVDMVRSFWGTWERSMDSGLIAHLHYGMFFVILAGMMRDTSVRKLLTSLVLGIAGLVALTGLYDVIDPPQLRALNPFGDTGLGRAQGTLANPITMATFLGVSLFLALYYFKHAYISENKDREHTTSRWLLIAVYALLLLVAIVISASRGPLLGLIAGILFLFIATPFLKSKKTHITIAALLLVLTLFTFSANALLQHSDAPSAASRISNISTGDSSVSNRLRTWRVAAVGIADRPYLGWGQEGFAYLFDQNYDPAFLTHTTAEIWWDRAHNIYLDTASTVGIVGLVFYLSLGMAAFIVALKTSVFLAAAIVFYGVSGLTFFDTLPTYMLFFFVLALISVESRRMFFSKLRNVASKNKKGKGGNITSFKFEKFSKPLLLVGSIFIILNAFVALNIARANYYMNQVGNLEYAQAVESFEAALSIEAVPETYKDEIRYEAAAYVVNAHTFGVLPNERKAQDFAFAKKAIETAFKHHPKDARAGWLAVRINNLFYEFSKDPQLLKDAEMLGWRASLNSPGRQQIFNEQAQTLLLMGEEQQALKRLRELVFLNRDFPGGYFALGLGHLATGNEEQALENIERARALGYPFKREDIANWRAVAKAYYERGDLDAVIEIYTGILSADPENIATYQNLAVTYAEAGEYKKAVETAQKIGELAPQLAPEVEAFIEEVEAQQNSQGLQETP